MHKIIFPRFLSHVFTTFFNIQISSCFLLSCSEINSLTLGQNYFLSSQQKMHFHFSYIILPKIHNLLSLEHLAVLAFAEAVFPLSAYLEPKWCLVKFKQAPVGWLKSNLRFFWIRRRKKEKGPSPLPLLAH